MLLAQFAVELAPAVGLLAHGLAQDDLRMSGPGRDAVFAGHAFQQHVQMQFPHAGDHAAGRFSSMRTASVGSSAA